VSIPLVEQSLAASSFDPTEAPIVRLSEVIAAMSTALDLTEGQPAGHAARSCILGMRLAEVLALPTADRSALYYALLMKDLGCSSNAAKISYLFGADDRAVKRDAKVVDWSRAKDNVWFAAQQVRPGARWWDRLTQLGRMAFEGGGATKQLIKTRCERGASIARDLGFPDASVEAIRQLDEHWDGQGQPLGLRGEEIALLARILGLAQTVEVFNREFGRDAALTMARERSGRWFDPELVKMLLTLRDDTPLWQRLEDADPWRSVAECEPDDEMRIATDADLDRIALAFAHMVDAKSPWTFRHSVGVAEIAVGIAQATGYDAAGVTRIRRAALLHDLGKLGVSNLVLDKPGRPTDDEFAAIKRHPEFSEQILNRIGCFAALAPTAGAHHEKLNGQGYFRGLAAHQLSLDTRLITVADIFEALSAARPYREAVPTERVLGILEREAGTAICPTALSGLQTWLARRNFDSRVESQLRALEQLQDELAKCEAGSCPGDSCSSY
jgi:HD-GYP domain-containing protein (c-di-GMP phosphodiesterase class II)